MHTFDYSFLKTIELPPYFLSLSNLIFTMKGKESAARKEYPSIYESLKQIAIVQSVKGSNAIEGLLPPTKESKPSFSKTAFRSIIPNRRSKAIRTPYPSFIRTV
jgi:hypothetical protein